MTTKQIQRAATTTRITTGHTTNLNMEIAMNKLTLIGQALYGWTRRANAGWAAFLVLNTTALSTGTPTLPVRPERFVPAVNQSYSTMKLDQIEDLLAVDDAPAATDTYAIMSTERMDALLAGNEAPALNTASAVNDVYANLKFQQIEERLSANEVPTLNDAYAEMKLESIEARINGQR